MAIIILHNDNIIEDNANTYSMIRYQWKSKVLIHSDILSYILDYLNTTTYKSRYQYNLFDINTNTDIISIK